MSNRDELCRLILGRTATTAVEAILAAGYRKPKVIVYLVISRDGRVIGEQFADREPAQTRADEWTNDCKTAGIDWDYRVAEIVEATS